MNKEEIIEVLDAMNFKVDYDQSEVKGWIRFNFKMKNLEKEFVWFLDQTDKYNFKFLSNLLFELGQTKKINDINKIEEL